MLMGPDSDVRVDWEAHLEEGGGNSCAGRVGGPRFGRREHVAEKGIIWTAAAVAGPLAPLLSFVVVVIRPVVHEVPHKTGAPFHVVLHLLLGGGYPVVGLLVGALFGAALGLLEGIF